MQFAAIGNPNWEENEQRASGSEVELKIEELTL